jgi:hypothetical protein
VLRTIVFTIGLLFVCSPVIGDSFSLSPSTLTIGGPGDLYLSAEALHDAKGMDIEIVFDTARLSCTAAHFNAARFPGFSEFHRIIDNESGYVELVILKQNSGGFTGSADSFFVLTFEPLSTCTTEVYIRKSYVTGIPMLLDDSNASIEADVDTATIIVPSVMDAGKITPAITEAFLYQNYPNPFNPSTTIRFDVPERTAVDLKIYDAAGRLVRSLLDGAVYGRGSWEVRWDGRNNQGKVVPSGVYFCSYAALNRRMTMKVILLR